jgi:uncharacterized membrane protein YphA (DoxX/SURF4 family)
MTRFYDSALALLRIVFSLLMMTHGWSKLERILEGNLSFGDPLAKKEMALLYLVGFLSVSLMGAGRYSIDQRTR